MKLQLADGTLSRGFHPGRIVHNAVNRGRSIVSKVPGGRYAVRRADQVVNYGHRRSRFLHDDEEYYLEDGTLARGGRGRAKFKKIAGKAFQIGKTLAPIGMSFIPGGGAATAGLRIAGKYLNPNTMGLIQKGINIGGKIKIARGSRVAVPDGASSDVIGKAQDMQRDDYGSAPGNTGMDMSKLLIPTLVLGGLFMYSQSRKR